MMMMLEQRQTTFNNDPADADTPADAHAITRKSHDRTGALAADLLVRVATDERCVPGRDQRPEHSFGLGNSMSIDPNSNQSANSPWATVEGVLRRHYYQPD